MDLTLSTLSALLPFMFSLSVQVDCHPASVVLNSIAKGEGSIGQRSVVAHSVLNGKWSIGEGSLVCGIRNATSLDIGSGLYVHEVELASPRKVRQLSLFFIHP